MSDCSFEGLNVQFIHCVFTKKNCYDEALLTEVASTTDLFVISSLCLKSCLATQGTLLQEAYENHYFTYINLANLTQSPTANRSSR